MKRNFNLITILFLVSIISFNSCKKEEEKPTKGFITGITVTDWLDENEDGEDWDGELQGYDPDIYFVIEDSNGNVLYNIGSDNRKENVDSTFSWSFSGVEINLETLIYIRLYDYDDLSSDDDMGACGGIKLSSYVNKEPKTIPVTCENMEYTLNISWAK